MLIAQSARGICAIFLGENEELLIQKLKRDFKTQSLIRDINLESIGQEILHYFNSPFEKFPLDLDVNGSKFQKSVWLTLCDIPFGSTLSYQDVAVKLGSRHYARAVGRACASNKLALVIPCHRAIAKCGDLAGYRWDPEYKSKLLKHEKQIVGKMNLRN